MMALACSALVLSFAPPSPVVLQSARAGNVQMSIARRELVGTFAAAVAAAPLAAFADGASSPAVRER